MDENRLEQLKQEFGEEAATAHAAAVDEAMAKYGKVIEVLTDKGGIVCRAPVGSKAAAYRVWLAAQVQIALDKADTNQITENLVIACTVFPSLPPGELEKALKPLFLAYPALPGDIVQQLVKLASSGKVTVAGN
jgi:hypothetical protein